MSWDDQWETLFASRAWGRYPPEELVRFVARSFGDAPDRASVRILELGCGPGANVWFLALARPKILELSDDRCVVRVPLNWITRRRDIHAIVPVLQRYIERTIDGKVDAESGRAGTTIHRPPSSRTATIA